MNCNYEISHNSDKSFHTFIFELILKNKLKQHNIIRCIVNTKHGNILSMQDNIIYDMIDKYKLTIIDINNPNNPVIIKNSINIINPTFFKKNNIYIEIAPVNNIMNIKYSIG